MNKKKMSDELGVMVDRLEAIQNECNESLKGYASGAAELAAWAVCHLIDLIRVADEVSE